MLDEVVEDFGTKATGHTSNEVFETHDGGYT
jgi:hypothetical protein